MSTAALPHNCLEKGMTDRLAIVTGGLGGLGTEFCRHLALRGHRVVAADLGDNAERVEAWKNAIGESGKRCHFLALDVSDHAACGTAIQQAESEHGPVDILVNGAGITRDVTLKKMAIEQWRDVMRVNLEGAFNMCRHVVPGMTERGFGRIINISSVNGQTGQFGQTNYSAAKAGMHGLTMALAREVAAKGVTVNSVAPGYSDTPMMDAIPEKVLERIVANIPVGRLAKPSEIARVVAFLADDDSGFITGAEIPVNGGYFIS